MTIDRDALLEKARDAFNAAWAAEPTVGERSRSGMRTALDAILPEVQAQTLEDAADDYSDWETFVAADGVTSIRMHGKDPDDWMRDRAAVYRKAASE